MTRRAARDIRSSAPRRPARRPARSRMRPAQRRDVDDGRAAHGPRPRGDGAARGGWPRAPTLAAASASPTIPAPPSRSRPRPRPQLPRLAALLGAGGAAVGALSIGDGRHARCAALPNVTCDQHFVMPPQHPSHVARCSLQGRRAQPLAPRTSWRGSRSPPPTVRRPLLPPAPPRSASPPGRAALTLRRCSGRCTPTRCSSGRSRPHRSTAAHSCGSLRRVAAGAAIHSKPASSGGVKMPRRIGQVSVAAKSRPTAHRSDLCAPCLSSTTMLPKAGSSPG